MKSLIFLPFIILLSAFTSSEMDYGKVLPNQIAYTINGGDLVLAETEKASVSAGVNMSRIAFKGTTCSRQFKVTDKLAFYAGVVKSAPRFAFSVIKLEVNEKKRFASFNSFTGKTIAKLPHRATSVGHPDVFHITMNEPLTVGHYAVVFKTVTVNGNFLMSNDYRNNPISFEIVE